MRFNLPAALAALSLLPGLLCAQVEYKVYTQHPRIWLEGRRLERLQKDAERESERWRNLQRLIKAEVDFPEEPLLRALLYQVSKDDKSAKKAVDWALAEASSDGFKKPAALRLGAIVFDWCYELLDDNQKSTLAPALFNAAKSLSGNPVVGLPDLRAAVLALVAVGDHAETYAAVLETLMKQHWEARLVPQLRDGKLLTGSEDLVALGELSHVARHNFEIEIWEQASDIFRALPLRMMMGVTPQPVRTEEGIFRVPVNTPIEKAALEGSRNRIAGMIFVAYENNQADYQFLQGWIRHDAVTLYTPLGAVYEFLWVNPYLPGLSYFSAPLVFHDEFEGRLYARAGWQDEDLWVAYIDHRLYIVSGDETHEIRIDDKQVPLIFPGAAIVFGRVPLDVRVKIPEGQAVYVVGLEEGSTHPVRVNSSRNAEQPVLKGGILVIENRVNSGLPEIDFEEPLRVRVREPK
ncbi:MAG: hypothetical protein O2968_13015 [Acidobacteria bacterium]|nr:hypothetical protein [Acidobacteriota bacterium]